MADEYLNGNVKDILEPMISALIIAQPEDPKFFMLHWLKNLYSIDYIQINKDKEELENLRLEVKGYKLQKNEINKPKVEQNLEEPKNNTEENQKEESENKNEKENLIENINANKNLFISADQNLSKSNEGENNGES